MNIKKPVTLIGLMGAGKTTVGLYLASKLEVDFVDSDREIEAQAGVNVTEIFSRDGEAFFRIIMKIVTIKNTISTSRKLPKTGADHFPSPIRR